MQIGTVCEENPLFCGGSYKMKPIALSWRSLFFSLAHLELKHDIVVPNIIKKRIRSSHSRCSVCLSNLKQLFHNQNVLMTFHYFNFDDATHSIKDVSVSTRQSLASSELFRIHG